MKAIENWTATAMGTVIEFWATAATTTTTELVATVNADGIDLESGKNYYIDGNVAIRELLTADRDYYVRTDGRMIDNDGLTDSAGGAFLTWQHAWDVISGLDMSTKSVHVYIGNGTYTGGLLIDKAPLGITQVVFEGDTTTPSNVVLSVAGNGIKRYCSMQREVYRFEDNHYGKRAWGVYIECWCRSCNW